MTLADYRRMLAMEDWQRLVDTVQKAEELEEHVHSYLTHHIPPRIKSLMSRRLHNVAHPKARFMIRGPMVGEGSLLVTFGHTMTCRVLGNLPFTTTLTYIDHGFDIIGSRCVYVDAYTQRKDMYLSTVHYRAQISPLIEIATREHTPNVTVLLAYEPKHNFAKRR